MRVFIPTDELPARIAAACELSEVRSYFEEVSAAIGELQRDGAPTWFPDGIGPPPTLEEAKDAANAAFWIYYFHQTRHPKPYRPGDLTHEFTWRDRFDEVVAGYRWKIREESDANARAGVRRREQQREFGSRRWVDAQRQLTREHWRKKADQLRHDHPEKSERWIAGRLKADLKIAESEETIRKRIRKKVGT